MAKGSERIVDAVFPSYFEFGGHPDGSVDLADGVRETVATVMSDEDAATLIKDREHMREVLIEILDAFPAAAGVVWDHYNRQQERGK